jgi:hypothetical protein
MVNQKCYVIILSIQLLFIFMVFNNYYLNLNLIYVNVNNNALCCRYFVIQANFLLFFTSINKKHWLSELFLLHLYLTNT